MTQAEAIQTFKAAFKTKAGTTNPEIRWGRAGKFWQTQTSLAEIVTKLEALARRTDSATMKGVTDAIDALPRGKATKYKDALDELKVELARTFVETHEAAPGIVKGKTPGGQLGFRTEDGGSLAEDLSATKGEYIQNVLDELDDVATSTGVAIDGLEKLVKSIASDAKMGADSGDLEGTVWEQAIAHLTTTVLPGIQRDAGTMERSGLLGRGATLAGVEFTGSDFHKGGKQVLILRFDDNGREKKVVYKPSSLMVDSLLFGDDGVASTLGEVSTYNIVPMTTDTRPKQDLGYGYMEFIDTGGAPSGATDVVGVYEGVAANMAMSYYVGLDDVHYENIIVKKGGVQIIDMEATTGVFNDKGNPNLGGFYDQLWNKAIYEGVRVELIKAIDAGTLTALPGDDEVRRAMVDKFKSVLGKMKSGGKKRALEQLETELARQTTRTVPIATNTFQKDLIPRARKCKNLKEWRDELDDENLLNEAKGQTSTPLTTIKNLLYTDGVFQALKRGDVPYYTRQLGSDKVADEKGEEIDVPGYKKVGEPIQKAMKQRREDSTDSVLEIFEKQGVKQVMDVQADLRTRLPAHGTRG
jgi:hypothetical protein